MNALNKIIDLIIAILLMFVIGTVGISIQQDRLTELYLRIETKEFSDTVRTQGYFTLQMYESFQKRLDAAGLHCTIDIQANRTQYEPEYINQVFTGGVMEYQEKFYMDEILAKLQEDRIYTFAKGDQLDIEVVGNKETLGMAFLNWLYHGEYQCRAYVTGLIRDAGK